MATTNRASLLNGLRTGGVRSTSITSPPPASSFNLPRFPSPTPFFPEDDLDQLSDLLSSNMYINGHASPPFSQPIDPQNTTFVHQQAHSHRPLNPNSAPFSPSHFPTNHHQQAPVDAQLHTYQRMQLMQLEILRLQNVQAQRNQQVQAAVLAEALRQQTRRSPIGFVPASAGPTTTSFDLNSNTPQVRRPNQAELLRAQLGVATAIPIPDDNVPMTAALGGRFGARLPPSSITFPSLPDAGPQSSSPPKQTTVVGGGLVCGGSPPQHAAKDNAPSRSDTASSWRRGNTTHSVLGGLRATSAASPSVKITPPPGERLSSPPLTPANKLRPRPLSFTSMASSNVPIVAIDSGSEHEDTLSSSSSTSQSNPATPQSLTSAESSSLSPREEATKKLFDGLGMGRPTLSIVHPPAVPASKRPLSQPLRQPKGPPSGADELGPKNFATRIRRKAIGGLGVLMDARERRESIVVY